MENSTNNTVGGLVIAFIGVWLFLILPNIPALTGPISVVVGFLGGALVAIGEDW